MKKEKEQEMSLSIAIEAIKKINPRFERTPDGQAEKTILCAVRNGKLTAQK